jgi:DNA polymerase-1
VISTPEALQKLLEKLDKADRIALDTETTSTSPLSASLVGISLAVQEGEGFYIPLGHKTGEPQLPIEKTIAELAPFLANPKKRIIGHNLKFDSLVLMKQGLTPKPLSFDTMIAEWLVDPASHRLGLKDMAEEFLNLKMTHITELIGKGKNQLTMADIPVETAASYAASDAEVTFRLVPILEKRLEDHKVSHLFHEIEMPLISVLAQMEFTGIKLDVPFFQKMAGELNHRLIEIDQQVMKVVGYRFNLNSTQQLSKALFESLQLEPPDRKQKTASGHYSTSADVLEELRGKHRVVDSILEYRELAKLKSTYVDALPQQINPATNRVHTSFSQTGSVTGRLASSEPNLQNIPTRTEIGRKVREGFIADPEMVLLSVDYSQIELRIVAHMSGDDAMLAAFQSGRDIHATTAAAIYNIPLEQVSKDQRRHSKAINFGLIYGMSAFGLTRTTDLTLAEAEDFVKAYFHEFPGVKKYLDGMRQTAARQGYVETLLGRRRYFPGLHSQTNNNIRNREEREAINAPIQGTAADIMKLAMIHLPGKLSQAGLKTRLLLQVHDELVLECPDTELNRAVQVVRDTMEHAYEISVPLLTEASYGINWGNLKPIS